MKELKILTQLYKDLSRRSEGNLVDKVTFLQFFPLPGLWGERLFNKFDTQHRKELDFEEFLTGLSICTKSTEEEKFRFLFSIFDL
jgi:Ca2+-binding EF-hand superfamily protein